MEQTQNQTHQRIFEVAEALFAERGYAAVRLRDIASALHINHAALYYYVPGGKEQLYVEVMTRTMHRHRRGMEHAITEAGPVLSDQMRAVAHWLLSQPPINLARMDASDFPAIKPDNARMLSTLAFDALRVPLEDAIERARAEGTVAMSNAALAAISFTSLIESLHKTIRSVPVHEADVTTIVEELIDMLLFGLLKR